MRQSSYAEARLLRASLALHVACYQLLALKSSLLKLAVNGHLPRSIRVWAGRGGHLGQLFVAIGT